MAKTINVLVILETALEPESPELKRIMGSIEMVRGVLEVKHGLDAPADVERYAVTARAIADVRSAMEDAFIELRNEL